MYYRFILPLTLLLLACNGKEKQKKEDEQYARIEQQDEKTIVKAQVAREDRFNLELVSNGKAEANRKATLNFDVADVVKKVNVKNGDRIRKGDIIAEVDDEKAKQTLEDALLSLKKAVLDLKLSIINEGFKTLDDTIKLTALRKEAMYLQCGYTSSLKAFEKAEKEYTLIKTRAPFDGIIADLEAKPYNQTSVYKSLCTLIDDSKMEVVFNVLETEIGNLHSGMEVEITPYANHKYTLTGKITEVNPRIDENGMVKVKAVTDNQQRILVDGMNVSILIKRQIDHKIIIPKSAVLPRQGKKVVFVYQKGKAMWRYVTTGYENSTEVSVEEGISPGDTVIYDNNLGLSHMNTVVIEN
ncbi:efflux RND transporter periplasmic adaptor subunit [Butyricimonas faecalis]|uniref:Efflux RND transporter periplasmic adaptor subunit n=1 Tax=Butyricimonas faecalis TaxID=2093856 RepID=A0A3Q9IN79_9BACT|nr:efflux RND transporter periplasmic adaptor subunit [Butyricimonas faecalis]AZS28159.1 efflux RND transporter periplasmic adaptor subunit [Butyricimonas faecalis]